MTTHEHDDKFDLPEHADYEAADDVEGPDLSDEELHAPASDSTDETDEQADV